LTNESQRSVSIIFSDGPSKFTDFDVAPDVGGCYQLALWKRGSGDWVAVFSPGTYPLGCHHLVEPSADIMAVAPLRSTINCFENLYVDASTPLELIIS
jgi:hypothetical protein